MTTEISQNFSASLQTLKEAIDGMVQTLQAEKSIMVAEAQTLGVLEANRIIDERRDALYKALREAEPLFNTSIAATKEACNTLLPIARLPPEILAYIFELVILDADFTYHHRAISRLARVTSHWRTLVESTPVLWSRITTRSEFKHMDKAIRRSKDLPLLVECTLPSTGGRHADVYMQRLRDGASRWRALKLEHDDALIRQHLIISLPAQLRYFSCTSTGDPPVGEVQVDFGGVKSATALEGVSLSKVSVHFYSSILVAAGSLRYLRIETLKTSPAVLHLILAIRSNPLLEHVHVSVISRLSGSMRGPRTPLNAGVTGFTMLSLKTLDMRGLLPFEVAQILKYGSFPAMKALNIRIRLSEQMIRTQDSAIELEGDLRSIYGSAYGGVSSMALTVFADAQLPTCESFEMQTLDKDLGLNYFLQLQWASAVGLDTFTEILCAAFGEDTIRRQLTDLLVARGGFKTEACRSICQIAPNIVNLRVLQETMVDPFSLFPHLQSFSCPFDPADADWFEGSLRKASGSFKHLNLESGGGLAMDHAAVVRLKAALKETVLVTVNGWRPTLKPPYCWGSEDHVNLWYNIPIA